MRFVDLIYLRVQILYFWFFISRYIMPPKQYTSLFGCIRKTIATTEKKSLSINGVLHLRHPLHSTMWLWLNLCTHFPLSVVFYIFVIFFMLKQKGTLHFSQHLGNVVSLLISWIRKKTFIQWFKKIRQIIPRLSKITIFFSKNLKSHIKNLWFSSIRDYEPISFSNRVLKYRNFLYLSHTGSSI